MRNVWTECTVTNRIRRHQVFRIANTQRGSNETVSSIFSLIMISKIHGSLLHLQVLHLQVLHPLVL